MSEQIKDTLVTCVKCNSEFRNESQWNKELCPSCSKQYTQLIKDIKAASMWHEHEKAYLLLELLLKDWTNTFKQILVYADIVAIVHNCKCCKAVRQLEFKE